MVLQVIIIYFQLFYFICYKNIFSIAGPTYELSIVNNYKTTSMKNWVIYKAKQALIKFGSSFYAAEYVVEGLRNKYSGHWNCIMGQKYTCNVYGKYEPPNYIHFYLGKIYISIYKSPQSLEPQTSNRVVIENKYLHINKITSRDVENIFLCDKHKLFKNIIMLPISMQNHHDKYKK